MTSYFFCIEVRFNDYRKKMLTQYFTEGYTPKEKEIIRVRKTNKLATLQSVLISQGLHLVRSDEFPSVIPYTVHQSVPKCEGYGPS